MAPTDWAGVHRLGWSHLVVVGGAALIKDAVGHVGSEWRRRYGV
jgi:hypothetical protein